jgi:hypothetical protein
MKIGGPGRGLAVKGRPTLIYDIKISTPTACLPACLLSYCWNGIEEGCEAFHFSESQPTGEEREAYGLCKGKGPLSLRVPVSLWFYMCWVGCVEEC